MKKKCIITALLAISAIYATFPLILNKEFIGGGWDLSQHVNWADQVNKGFREGILYPRWLSLSNSGYGSPTMIFYSPLFYLLTGIVNLFVPSLIISLKIASFTGFFLSGVFMYILLRNFCSTTASIAGSIAYQLLPYHVFSFYAREAIAETFAFIWPPLIIHFAYKGFMEKLIANLVGMAFSYAGLILTHIASAYIFTFVIVCLSIFFFIGQRSFLSFLKFAIAMILAFLISAVYFIPMLFERKFVHIELMTKIWGEFKYHLLFKNEGYFDIELILSIMSALLMISMMLSYYLRTKLKERHTLYIHAFFYLIFILSVYMSTPLSTPIWTLIQGLQTLVFPWRWMAISTFAVSVLIGITIDSLSLNAKKDTVIRMLTAIFCVFIFINFYLSSLYIIAARPMQNERLQQMLTERTDMATFRPIWHTQQKERDFATEGWIPVRFKHGDGNIEIVSWGSQSRIFHVNASSASIIRVSTFYYPGWTAFMNGNEISIEIEDESGAMLLSIPQGKSTVLLEFKDTPLRKFASWTSILSIIAAFISVFIERLRFNPSSFDKD